MQKKPFIGTAFCLLFVILHVGSLPNLTVNSLRVGSKSLPLSQGPRHRVLQMLETLRHIRRSAERACRKCLWFIVLTCLSL